ncbi:patatin-like phospholipase domain-containing protein 4 [Saccoglossus kowalevskii]|uniref:Patatin-like phospholipase domain-containing protein 4-like n=1 Tax=Saccoglossus kowalevskii TaxID=10224 RepID=A0ABM0GRQ5_SACKO|nr:PREDICTED: patatin-like phospholipase domain-containing protein 4-like [Saccoglossus kowalevskii]
MSEYLKPPFNVAFTGSSFMGALNAGSAQCLLDHGRDVSKDVQAYGGVSSGSLIAAIMAIAPNRLQDFLRSVHRMAEDISQLPSGALSKGYDMIVSLRNVLTELLPEDCHEKASGMLFLCFSELIPVDPYAPLTTHDVDQGTSSSVFTRGPKRFQVGPYYWQLGERMIASHYASKNELIETLLGCIYVPWFEGWQPPAINGRYMVDGSLSHRANLPEEVQFPFPPGKLIRIHPNPKNHAKMRDKIAVGWVDTSGQRFDISPLHMFRVGDGLFAPPQGNLEAYYVHGYEDATSFLKFYHSYEENSTGLNPRKTQYAAIHSIADLAP